MTAAKKTINPRTVPPRDDKYMGLAFWVGSFSKDPSTQVGAIIIAEDNTPLGTGYNGPPKPMSDHEMDWGRPGKYPYMIHAEANAIDHSHGSLVGATVYVTGLPCDRCMLRMASKRIARCVYFPYSSRDPGSSFGGGNNAACLVNWELTQEIARKNNVSLSKFSGNLNWMRDRIRALEKAGIFG